MAPTTVIVDDVLSVGIVIIAIFTVPGQNVMFRQSGLLSAMVIFSHDVTNSTIEIQIPEVGVQLPERRRVTQHLYSQCMTVRTGVGKRLHTLPSHPTLGELRGVSSEER